MVSFRRPRPQNFRLCQRPPRAVLSRPNVDAINAIEDEDQGAVATKQLAAKTIEFRKQLAEGKTLDDILVPAFAVVREASRRVLGLRPFDVQLIGGMILHAGAIAEMKTGEGKTLVATLARLPECACRQGRPRRYRQRLPRTARRRQRWAASTASSGSPPASSSTACPTTARATPTPATSPMPRTTSSVSIIFATT